MFSKSSSEIPIPLSVNVIVFLLYIFDFGLFPLAVFLNVVNMAVSSSASFINYCTPSCFIRPLSTINSNQHKVSSASSSTIEIFEIKSAVLLALQEAR